ncbi:MAG: hypothetical protein WDO14_25655 [Bacteroidota bacterium]
MKRIVLLLLVLITQQLYARTFTAIANGNWVTPRTWSCNCTPAHGDNVIIPYGITVQISRPVVLDEVVLSVAGVLDLTNGLLQMKDSDRVTVVPGGKIVANGLGGRIVIGLTSHDLRSGSTIVGPATIGASILNVALMFFEAEANENELTLRWASAGELDVRRYEVFCYHDSTRFETLGELQGLNYSLKRHDYKFQVENPHDGVEFYRLEAVAHDSTRMVISTVSAK